MGFVLAFESFAYCNSGATPRGTAQQRYTSDHTSMKSKGKKRCDIEHVSSVSLLVLHMTDAVHYINSWCMHIISAWLIRQVQLIFN